MDRSLKDEYNLYNLRANRNSDDHKRFIGMLISKYPRDNIVELGKYDIFNDDDLIQYREILTINHECDEYFLRQAKKQLRELDIEIKRRTKTKEDNK